MVENPRALEDGGNLGKGEFAETTARHRLVALHSEGPVYAVSPNRLWVADITYVATWAGFAYVAFVIDVFSRTIVGWNVAATLKADVLPLQALNMAAFNTRGSLDDLVHHADHGSNYLSVVYTDRIAELGARPSTGTVGDSYDCQSVFTWFRKNWVVPARAV